MLAPAKTFTAKEIENLRQESQALNSIRQSMGSDDFTRKVFEKVFKDDINRLRSMEDMWKTRKPPHALEFDELSKRGDEITTSICQQNQRVWTEAENFAVFRDRYISGLCLPLDETNIVKFAAIKPSATTSPIK